VSSERLPPFAPIHTQPAPASSASSSPRGGSFSASSANGSASSHTSYSSSINGASSYKTPSPEHTPQHLNAPSHQESPYHQQGAQGYGYTGDSYSNMNQIQPYPTDVHQPHMSGASVHGSSSGPPAIGHYGQYQHPHPPLLQPGPQAYSSAPPYQYPYNGIGTPSTGNPAATPMSSAMVPQSLPLPGKFANVFQKYLQPPH